MNEVADLIYSERIKALVEKAMRARNIDPERRGSISEFARLVNVNPGTVRYWLMLRPDRMPDASGMQWSSVTAIADVLGWDLDRFRRYLDTGDDSPKAIALAPVDVARAIALLEQAIKLLTSLHQEGRDMHRITEAIAAAVRANGNAPTLENVEAFLSKKLSGYDLKSVMDHYKFGHYAPQDLRNIAIALNVSQDEIEAIAAECLNDPAHAH